MVTGAYTKNTFIQDSINKMISTSDTGSRNSLLWHNENNKNFRRSRRSLRGDLI